MIKKFFLVVSPGRQIRALKSKPSLEADEIAISMSLELPNSLFEKPALSASIVVSEKDVPQKEITPQIINNIEQAIEFAADMKVKIEFVPIPVEDKANDTIYDAERDDR